ncbi:MAG: hypothetical protein GY929_22595 [Actinomycetia bacterium]|nr:hypothetical protein [Actinomycetes bacterium]
MIPLFARLKVRLLRNTLRTSSGYTLVIFTILTLGLSVSLSLLILSTSAELHRWLAPVLTFAIALGWMAGPLLFGAADETIDTTRLALFPLRGRELAPGVATASLLGPGPVAAALPLFAFAARPLRDPTWSGPLRSLLILVAGVTTLAFAIVLSRLLLTALGNALRRRNRRDFATLIAGLGAGGLAVGSQVLLALGFDRGTLLDIGHLVRWLPGGWTGEAVGRLAAGEPMGLPVLLIGVTGGITATLAVRWTQVLDTALTEVSDDGAADSIGDHILADPRWGWDRIVPSQHRGDAQLLRLVMAKEVRYLRRHPRYRIQVVTQGLVLILGGAPFISAILDRRPESVLVGCVPALTAGITSSNLFGADGRALWAEVLAVPSLRIVLRGRSLTFALMGLMAALVVTVASAAWTAGWQYVPIALGAAVGMAFTGAAVGSFTSTLAPVNFPDDDNPNPFATENTGQGCVTAIITFVGVIIGLGMAGPILVGLSWAQNSLAGGLTVMAVAPPYGLGLYLLLTDRAARRADGRAPELVALLT